VSKMKENLEKSNSNEDPRFEIANRLEAMENDFAQQESMGAGAKITDEFRLIGSWVSSTQLRRQIESDDQKNK